MVKLIFRGGEMAKFRYINTSIWDDEWFTSLDALEQHLFLYFLTNAYSDISGVYQVPLRKIAFETGMDQEKVKKILLRFHADGKVFYEMGWIIMKNWHKHQALNPNQLTAVVKLVNAMPEWLRILILDAKSEYNIPFESLTKGSITVEKGSLGVRYNPKSNTNTNTNTNPKGNNGVLDLSFLVEEK
jgi:hypothetical protein